MRQAKTDHAAAPSAIPATETAPPQRRTPRLRRRRPASSPSSLPRCTTCTAFNGVLSENSTPGLDQCQPELDTYRFVPGSAANLYTGDFDLFLHSRLTEKTSVLADITFEEADAQSYKVDLRQALLKYEMNDHLKISLGRYQTGIGYYNTAFRSAAWLQTTADRPLIMEYASNGGLLPTQAVGILLTGAIPSGELGLNYIAEYGSSDTIRPDINGSGLFNNENDGNHVLLGWFARPDWAPGLQLGGSFFHDKISDSEMFQAERFGQTILNSYLVYIAHGIESLNEVFLIRETQLANGVVFNMPALLLAGLQALGAWASLRSLPVHQRIAAEHNFRRRWLAGRPLFRRPLRPQRLHRFQSAVRSHPA